MEREFVGTVTMGRLELPLNTEFRKKISLSTEELDEARKVMTLTLESTEKLITPCTRSGKPLHYRISVKDFSDKLSDGCYHANVFTSSTGYPFFGIKESVGEMSLGGNTMMKCMNWLGDEDFLLGGGGSSSGFHVDAPLAFPTRITVRTYSIHVNAIVHKHVMLFHVCCICYQTKFVP